MPKKWLVCVCVNFWFLLLDWQWAKAMKQGGKRRMAGSREKWWKSALRTNTRNDGAFDFASVLLFRFSSFLLFYSYTYALCVFFVLLCFSYILYSIFYTYAQIYTEFTFFLSLLLLPLNIVSVSIIMAIRFRLLYALVRLVEFEGKKK